MAPDVAFLHFALLESESSIALVDASLTTIGISNPNCLSDENDASIQLAHAPFFLDTGLSPFSHPCEVMDLPEHVNILLYHLLAWYIFTVSFRSRCFAYRTLFS